MFRPSSFWWMFGRTCQMVIFVPELWNPQYPLGTYASIKISSFKKVNQKSPSLWAVPQFLTSVTVDFRWMFETVASGLNQSVILNLKYFLWFLLKSVGSGNSVLEKKIYLIRKFLKNRRRTSEVQKKNIRTEQWLSLFEFTVTHYLYTGQIRSSFSNWCFELDNNNSIL